MAGCDSSDSSEVNDGTKEQDELQAGIQTIGKAQRIEVRSDSDDNDSVLRSITDKADIEIFIEQLKMNEWEYAPALPEEAKKSMSILFCRRIPSNWVKKRIRTLLYMKRHESYHTKIVPM